MRATIDVQEKRGLFSTSWIVDCRIEFTAAEHAAIDYGKLGDRVLYSYGRDPEVEVTLGHLRRNGGVRSVFSTLLAAQRDNDFIEHRLLPNIKSLLAAVDGFKTGTRTIEL